MIRPTAPALLAALLALAGCDSARDQSAFFDQAHLPPSGYTRVEACGQPPAEVDEDDWRVAPAFTGNVRVDAACPNPVGRDGLATLTVTDLFGGRIPGGVYALAFDQGGRQVPSFLVRDEGPGTTYVLSIEATQLRLVGGEGARLYRLLVFAADHQLISYGDVLVE